MPLIVLLLMLLLAVPSHALDAGDIAPEFELIDGQRGKFTLNSLKGKFVYLDFWATWCGPCKRSMPWMKKIRSKFGPSGLEIVAVNLDTDDKQVEKFLKDNAIDLKVLRDPEGKTPSLYKVLTMPTSFLIGPDGHLIYVHPGFSEDEQDDIEKILERSLNKESRT